MAVYPKAVYPKAGRSKAVSAKAGRRLGALLVPALVLALAACTGGTVSSVPDAPDGPVSDELATALSGFLGEAQAAAGATGAVAGVWSPWAGGWETAIGVVGDGDPTPLTTDARVRLGTGGTEAMTCDVVVALAEEGRVDLDADVAESLTSLPGIEGLTLRQLCAHTSGLADFRTVLWPTVIQNPIREWPTIELLSAAQVRSAIAAPGASWSDSATGPLLAGLVVSEATGRSVATLYQDFVVPRYGLRSTSLPSAGVVDLPAPAPRGYSAGLAADGAVQCEVRRDVSAASPSALGAAGGAITDLEDLRRLAAGLASDPAGDAVWADPVPQGQGRPDWLLAGLGGHQAGPLRGFSGVAPGFVTAAYSDPVSGLTVAVSLNSSTPGADFAANVARGLAAIAVAQPGAEGAPGLPWTVDSERNAVLTGYPRC
ncbi:serine hydrolase domain-containing protein [Rathayibacter oskolensis]|uniref:serine hydrolase domain-containing protein n=1 Tax=Rathayibacter oskolensis TaxID=1891671 RepID=UPI00265FA4E7|nr:serine hydrolase domain-containing protein [Rathayibacter oskolensis]WKK72195.1 serine hydrolase domain-containing protein [Rathayibacter oskolensis]